MTDFLLDTNAASDILLGRRRAVTSMRRSGARSISISSVSQSELLFGAHIFANPDLMTKVRHFLDRIDVRDWDKQAAEAHALLRAQSHTQGRGAGVYDLMIAAHAVALDMTLVTSDRAIANLGTPGLRIVAW